MEYHEPLDALPEEVRDHHRAMKSLIEEIEAVDWYHQRVAATRDAGLAAVLAHNRNEEMEHACMVLEHLRRHMPGWDEQLRQYLFTEAPIVAVEGAAAGEGPEARSDLGIGDLRGE
jgi:ferritin-like protein